MPSLFVPYYKEENNYLMLVKIPRNIDRRNAKPGMDLYDYVIGMYEDYMYILKRTNTVVEEIKVLYDDIDGMEVFTELLSGTFNIYLKNGRLAIIFNTASKNIIMKMAKIIRNRYTKKIFKDIKGQDISKKINVDDLFVNLLKNIKSEEDEAQVCAIQPSVPVVLNKGKIPLWLQNSLPVRMLINTVHLSNNQELIILTRGTAFKKKRKANYGLVFTYIPIDRLCSVTIQDYEKYDNILELNIKINENEFMYYCEKNNKEFINFYNNLNDCIKSSFKTMA